MTEDGTDWAALLDLDARSQQTMAAMARAAHLRIAALQAFATRLPDLGAPGLAQRLTHVGTLAPSVLASAAAWRWLHDMLDALRRRDAALLQARSDLGRFELAAAMLSGTNCSVSLLPGPTVLPTVDLVVQGTVGRTVEVEDGTLSPDARSASLPTVGAVVIDAVDTALRRNETFYHLPADHPNAERWRTLVEEAMTLAVSAAPRLRERLMTRLVPVGAEPGCTRSATDEEVPGATYLSFGADAGDVLEALVHEEAHALLNAASACGLALPVGEWPIDVPWKDRPRPLPAVIHGLAAFSRVHLVDVRLAEKDPDDRRATAMAERTRGWVLDVTERLLDGAAGPLPAHLESWLEHLREVVDGSRSNMPGNPSPWATAIRASAAGERWWLLDGGVPGGLAQQLRNRLEVSPFRASSTDFYDQWSCDLIAAGVLRALPELERWIDRYLTSAASELLGAPLDVLSVTAHRLRRGQSIGAHTDHGDPALRARAVIGLTPGWSPNHGGLLVFHSNRHATVGFPPELGSVLLFEVHPTAVHEVGSVQDVVDRLTAVVSFRQRQ